MAQNINVQCAPGVWTQLTAADVSAIRVQNLGADLITIMATTGTSAPSGTEGAITLDVRDILAANLDLADLFPGVTAGYRVWGHSGSGATVSVSHS